MMKKNIILMLVAVSLMAGSAIGSVVFSGETWETWAGVDVVIGGDGVSYGSADHQTSGVNWEQVGAFGVDKTFSIGDIISFNVTMTGANGDGPGDNTNAWLGYLGSGFTNAAHDWSGGYSSASSIHEFPLYGGGNLPASGITLDVSYEFTSATEAHLIVTEVTGFPAVWANGPIAVNVADIAGFYVADWNTQQTMTVSNFEVVPEPATMILLGLGGLLLRRKR